MAFDDPNDDMMRKPVDRTGRKYGRLTVLGRVEDYVSPAGHRQRRWLVQCECGSPAKAVMGSNLQSGVTRSCGCYATEVKRSKRR